MKALQLPRGSDAEKELRTRAVGDASVTATEVPLDILDLGNEVLEVAGQVRDGILPAIVADVTAGVELVSAMSSVARENALANLPGVAAPDALRERLSQAVARRGTLLAAFKDG
jgi:formiminotetrahydrofolate cyclodeaminase